MGISKLDLAVLLNWQLKIDDSTYAFAGFIANFSNNVLCLACGWCRQVTLTLLSSKQVSNTVHPV